MQKMPGRLQCLNTGITSTITHKTETSKSTLDKSQVMTAAATHRAPLLENSCD